MRARVYLDVEYTESVLLTSSPDTPRYIIREWDESGQLWIQKVSSTPATRLDVINLQVLLERLCVARNRDKVGF